jgi:hypothetical protein
MRALTVAAAAVAVAAVAGQASDSCATPPLEQSTCEFYPTCLEAYYPCGIDGTHYYSLSYCLALALLDAVHQSFNFNFNTLSFLHQ